MIRVHKAQVGEPFDAAWVRHPLGGAAGAIVLDVLFDEEHPQAWSAAYEDSLERLAHSGNRPHFDDHTIALAIPARDWSK
ncbi:hypothetical protein BG418_25090 [Streptomyces sp. CBMA152]|nr:hypothetical protein [Streptomyces sp. CBMA152]